jgi:hypothetical protein
VPSEVTINVPLPSGGLIQSPRKNPSMSF